MNILSLVQTALELGLICSLTVKTVDIEMLGTVSAMEKLHG